MRKRGFTLIELLAVIVILAIIALIATPMIMNVIDKAKQGAVEASTLGYVDGVEKYTVLGLIDGEGLDAGVYDVTDETTLGSIQFKGETPTAGWFAVDGKGLVVAASLQFNSYKSKWVGYTVTDGAKATLDNTVTKPTQTDGNPITDELLKSATESVHTALNPKE